LEEEVIVFGNVRTAQEFWRVRCRVASRCVVHVCYVLTISDITVIVIQGCW